VWEKTEKPKAMYAVKVGLILLLVSVCAHGMFEGLKELATKKGVLWRGNIGVVVSDEPHEGKALVDVDSVTLCFVDYRLCVPHILA
jgi:hypothetical protein